MLEPWPDPNQRTAIYRFYAADDELLYVGITNDPLRRFGAHSRQEPVDGAEHWWPLVERWDVRWMETRTLAVAAESEAIKEERPRYNYTHNGRQFRFPTPRFPATQLHPLTLAHFGDRPFSFWDLVDELGIPKGTVTAFGNRLRAQGLFRPVGRWRAANNRMRNYYVAVPADQVQEAGHTEAPSSACDGG
ncbi:GIY-YIG nuclease family protein [Streptomyces sp. HUCO-GS316]|uniref:GIY-YIG nuclease family protein n=1 Tax=Streptomyces sp. HUCO-GS316 TaxID=2692198 RepID=UPI00136BE147|nr:GIY-YIG nuclease family protein [Streptomyces sp. HUCO-GS316]MXM66767.1 GIY-YIG nuclease family protein [Streptomyces sp. HUCO-GS316]